jgi:hypothetical protein
MWSLAVEEQFYLLWPVVLFLVAVLVRGRSRLPVIGGIAAAGVVFSAVRLYMLWDPISSDRAYMGTDSRIFEPLLGAVLAVLLMWRPRLGSSRISNAVLVVSGVVVIVAGLGTLAGPSGASALYPNGGALVFSLGAAALIWAVATRESVTSSVLSLPPIAYLGRISYGIYIWHWPLICWVNSHQLGLGRLADAPLGLRAYILVLLTVALAALSYHLVEKPIRYGTLGKRLKGIRVMVALPAVIAVVLALNLTLVVVHAGATIQLRGFGPNGGPTKVTKTIVVVGDSVTQYFAPELADAAARLGYTVVSAAHPGCPATGMVYPPGWPYRHRFCTTVADEQDAVIRKYHPALVLWWSRYEVASRLPGALGQHVEPATAAYARAQEVAFDARVKALSHLGARIVAIQIEHPGLRAHGRMDLSLAYTMINYWRVVRRWNAFLAEQHGPRAFSIAIDDVVCHTLTTYNTCTDKLPNGGSARPRDGIHYTPAAGPEVAPVIIRRALRAAGLPA